MVAIRVAMFASVKELIIIFFFRKIKKHPDIINTFPW